MKYIMIVVAGCLAFVAGGLLYTEANQANVQALMILHFPPFVPPDDTASDAYARYVESRERLAMLEHNYQMYRSIAVYLFGFGTVAIIGGSSLRFGLAARRAGR